MTTIATLLSGGECVGVGARAAGLTHLWGYEIENDIAQVARDNGFNVTTADVMGLDPTQLTTPDVLHASPVCKRASGANQSAELNEDGTKEAPEDIEMGYKIAQFIDVMTPRIVTIENVFAYRNFKAFKIICNVLNRNGYMWDFDNLNAADYGVPQTRRRLILRAIRGALLPNLPQPEKWVGWYESIFDLIPTLPESRFAPWQLERLPEKMKTFAIGSAISAPIEIGAEPIDTITLDNGTRYRAFIVDCQKAGDTETERGVTLRQGDAPVFTITGGKGKRQPVRAWLVQGGNQWSPVVSSNEPSPTVNNVSRVGNIPRAWLSQGRVVSMTPRTLARFQSIPDSYILPESKALACKVIGNGVPPLLYQKIIQSMVGGLT